MIDEDKAMEIAREELAEDIRKGGMPTLFGYADHWKASCTFPDRSIPEGHKPKYIRIDFVDGAVTVI
jgi:hypothetical protein